MPDAAQRLLTDGAERIYSTGLGFPSLAKPCGKPWIWCAH
jgi:hypothetical protein